MTTSWEKIATVSADWTEDANATASELADAVERRFGVERMIEGAHWPNYQVLIKADAKLAEKARVFAVQWLADHGYRNKRKSVHATKGRKTIRLVGARVTTFPDTGQTQVRITWSDGASTVGAPSSVHMQELIRRAEREGVRVKYGLLGEER